jgi:hypothetical protein
MERSRGQAHPRSSANYVYDSFRGLNQGRRAFHLSSFKVRLRGDVDVTCFQPILDRAGIRVAAAIAMRDGSLFASGRFPAGERPAVLFRYPEGRPSQARTSLTDARTNGFGPKGSRIVGALIEGYRAIPHYRVRILKLCILSFHLFGLQGNTPGVSPDGVSRPCLSIGSPSSWISCFRGERKAGARIIKSVPTTRVDSMAFFKADCRLHRDVAKAIMLGVGILPVLGDATAQPRVQHASCRRKD